MNKARRRKLRRIMLDAHSLYKDITLYDNKARGKQLFGVCLSYEMTGRHTGKKLRVSKSGRYVQGTIF